MTTTLVPYSDSEDEDDGSDSEALRKRVPEESEKAQSVKKPPPALPAKFQNLYSSNVRSSTSDDPALHGGRQRQVPHTVGNWPTFVYLEWLPSDEENAFLEQEIAIAANELQSNPGAAPHIQSSLRSDVGVRLPLHISLSAPLMLTTENKDKFEAELTNAIQDAKVPAFEVILSALRWVSNFDSSRYFLILTLNKPRNKELQRLLTACNRVAKEFNLPELYAADRAGSVGVPTSQQAEEEYLPTTTKFQDNDKFHISIGWTLQRPETFDYLESAYPEYITSLGIHFTTIRLKIGNQITAIPLDKI